jgi:anti-sigma factor RsiW
VPPPPDDLPCQELVELCTAYIEGALSPELRARFDDHLRICDGCELYVEQMRATIRLAGKLTAEDLGPAARERMLKAFRTWHRRDANPPS